jgi:NDP-sugar pyrophosphorylase family protein
VRAVVLAGGEGTRLRPLTYALPKPLLPIANRPFLERQLAWLAGAGVDEVILSIGYRPDAFLERFPGGSVPGTSLRLRLAVEPEPLGTAGAIRFAATAGDIAERFLVCNGDVLSTLDLTALLRFHDQRGAQATIALTRVEDPSAFGVVPTTPDGRVLGFVEKPAPGQAPTDWINAGVYVFEPSVLAAIPEGRAVSVERETFPALLAADGKLFARPDGGYWLDIGTPEKYLQAHTDALAGRLGPLPGAELAPGVRADGSVVVEEGARLIAPVLLAGGCRVEAGAEVARSVLGPGCTVAGRARVSGSVLLAGARVGPGATVDGSLVGPEAAVEEGASVSGLSVLGRGARARGSLAGARLNAEGR